MPIVSPLMLLAGRIVLFDFRSMSSKSVSVADERSTTEEIFSVSAPVPPSALPEKSAENVKISSPGPPVTTAVEDVSADEILSLPEPP